MPLDGTARMLQDKIYTDLDTYNGGGCCCGYLGEVNGFLANPNQDIWTRHLSLRAILGLFIRAVGNRHRRAGGGSGFYARVVERAQANNSPPDVVKATREAIAHYSTSETLEERFQDFTIANYTKLMNLSALSSPMSTATGMKTTETG